jgi:predicted alpha/beta superfamily hydrolase
MKILKLLVLFFSIISFSCAEESVSEDAADTLIVNIPMKSVDVGDQFVIDISLPKSYAAKPDMKYPVMYLTDGNWRRAQHKSIHNLAESDNVKELIVVGIGYPDNYDVNTIRVRDFISSPDKYLDFILKEVIPYIEQKYRTTSERTLWGSSFGGYFTMYSLFQYNEKTKGVFKNYIAASATAYQTTYYLGQALNLFDYENLLSQKTKELKVNLYLTVGGNEDSYSFIQPFNKLIVSLDSRLYTGFNLQFYCDPGKDHYTVWEPTLYQGIKLFMKNE